MGRGAKDANVTNEKIQKSDKEKQLDIITKTNPMTDDYHVGIRSVNDIKTLREAIDTAIEDGEDGDYPDWPTSKAENAQKTGMVTIYSSHPIENGVFVTPSKMMAQDYAGGRNAKIYSKNVPISDIAWINMDEGQFARIK